MALKDLLAAQAAKKAGAADGKASVATAISTGNSVELHNAGNIQADNQNNASGLKQANGPPAGVIQPLGLMAQLRAEREKKNAKDNATGIGATHTSAAIVAASHPEAAGKLPTVGTLHDEHVPIAGGSAGSEPAKAPTIRGISEVTVAGAVPDGKVELAGQISPGAFEHVAKQFAGNAGSGDSGDIAGGGATNLGIHESLDTLRKSLAYLADNIEYPEVVASTVRTLGQQLKEKPELAAFMLNGEFDLLVRGFRRAYQTASRQKTEQREKKASKVKGASEFENIFNDMDIKL